MNEFKLLFSNLIDANEELFLRVVSSKRIFQSQEILLGSKLNQGLGVKEWFEEALDGLFDLRAFWTTIVTNFGIELAFWKSDMLFTLNLLCW